MAFAENDNAEKKETENRPSGDDENPEVTNKT